ncbi:DUF3606 domain-containing protein [Mucilaginibacter paludis]|uniref:DUF3606 domain-containing protein n=1 Tax=Mucilaginibacter paludis DSM 18603 TaxID=714943 RepID=H1YCA4_9SPHI|nr:DUF3606 domain-containing protein [Mucilaginibacter paludis]EHQ30095.1 hypothetical protein Mucpa_6037 [Mucilaginibacter paludis DSM 18603]
MDDDSNMRSLDTERINIHEYYEVEHWTKELNTNVEALKQAVATVGTSIKDIEKYLKQ